MIIGIVHHESTKKFLPALLKSLKGVKYQTIIVYNDKETHNEKFPFPCVCNPWGGYELGALALLMITNPQEQDFFLLHATTVIKDLEIFDIAAQFKGTLALSQGLMSFMGKYRREIIDKIGVPVPRTREAAIYWEYFWNIVYLQQEKKISTCDSPLVDTKKFEMKFGRKNMVLENKYIKKWKSNWRALDLKMPAPESFIPKRKKK